MRRYALCADLGIIVDGDRVFAAALPRGPIVVLAGVAASVWRAAPGSDLGGIATRLATEGASEAGEAERDAALYVQALVDAGLLREVEDAR